MAKVIAMFEKEERALKRTLRAVPKQTPADRQVEHAREVRARALALIKRIDAQIAKEADPYDWDSAKRATAETIARSEDYARAHRDPPEQKFEPSVTTWRGAKLPGLTWRGRKI